MRETDRFINPSFSPSHSLQIRAYIRKSSRKSISRCFFTVIKVGAGCGGQNCTHLDFSLELISLKCTLEIPSIKFSDSHVLGVFSNGLFPFRSWSFFYEIFITTLNWGCTNNFITRFFQILREASMIIYVFSNSVSRVHYQSKI